MRSNRRCLGAVAYRVGHRLQRHGRTQAERPEEAKSPRSARGHCQRSPCWEVRSPSGAEVHDRRAAADTLDPDVLYALNVRGDVLGGDDHLRVEGLVVTVTGAVEVRVKPHRVLVGGCGLQALRRRARALEVGARPEIGRVPTHALSGETAIERALQYRSGAAESAARVDEAGIGVVGTAAG